MLGKISLKLTVFTVSILLAAMVAGVFAAGQSSAATAGGDVAKAGTTVAAEDTISAVKESFVKTFPNTPVTEIRTTPVDGVFEILTNETILYYFPKTSIILMGGMWSNDGKDLTGDRYAEIMLSKMKALPLEAAIKVGKGTNQVVEITDPDCPFCRKADDFLKSRQDVTRYVFLFPLKQLHPDSENKSRYILCQKQKNQSTALEEVMSGKIDGKPYEVCKNVKVDERMKIFEEVGQKLNVRGTPMLIVNGHLVSGANIPLITKFLDEKSIK